MHRKAIGYIRQWVDNSLFHHVYNETDAKALWDKVEKRNEQESAVNKAFLIRKLVNMKFKDESSVVDHLNEFQSVVKQLATMKMMLDDGIQALLLLSSLFDSWETLVIVVSNATTDGIVTMS